MATILNDREIKKLLGTVIIGGDDACIKPNGYVLRLGGAGEFINTGKKFTIGTKKKKGICVPPGQSVGITARETLDFSEETVKKLYPGKALHGIVSLVTDLLREGVSALTAQVDAGYKGTLNWTLVNTSNADRKYTYEEKIYRLTILMLDEGEKPESFYAGNYQSQTGYVGSTRRGAPIGMKASEWETAYSKDGPEVLLDNLIKSGYPWNILGTRLKEIDGQFQEITEEYGKIYERLAESEAKILKALKEEVSNEISESFKGEAFRGAVGEKLREIFREEADNLQNRWMVRIFLALMMFFGASVAIFTDDKMLEFLKEYGGFGGILALFSIAGFIWLTFKRK